MINMDIDLVLLRCVSLHSSVSTYGRTRGFPCRAYVPRGGGFADSPGFVRTARENYLYAVPFIYFYRHRRAL